MNFANDEPSKTLDDLISEIIQSDGILLNWIVIAQVQSADKQTTITIISNEDQNVVASAGLSMALSQRAAHLLAQGSVE